jgi:hypothetical protein
VPKRLPHPFVLHDAAAVVTEFPSVPPQALHEKILKIKDADRCACVVIGNKKVRLGHNSAMLRFWTTCVVKMLGQ